MTIVGNIVNNINLSTVSSIWIYLGCFIFIIFFHTASLLPSTDQNDHRSSFHSYDGRRLKTHFMMKRSTVLYLIFFLDLSKADMKSFPYINRDLKLYLRVYIHRFRIEICWLFKKIFLRKMGMRFMRFCACIIFQNGGILVPKLYYMIFFSTVISIKKIG